MTCRSPTSGRQGEAYCQSRGYQLVETYVGPGASATNDRRPEFQRMMEAGTEKPPAFDVVIWGYAAPRLRKSSNIGTVKSMSPWAGL